MVTRLLGSSPCRRGELGTVEVGKLADLIAVEANPLEDIANLRRLLLVLEEGRIVSDRRADRRGTTSPRP